MRPIRFAALAVLAGLPAAVHAAPPIAGQWLTPEDKAIVTIAPCDQGMCGRITKLLKPSQPGPAFDRKNADPALRGRPIVGLSLFEGLREAKTDWQGMIYSPERGRSFRAFLSRRADGKLDVKGCVAFLCQTQVWRPAP